MPGAGSGRENRGGNELWQAGDKNKPLKLGTIFWDWYGLQSMTPADGERRPHQNRVTKTKPMIYHADLHEGSGPDPD